MEYKVICQIDNLSKTEAIVKRDIARVSYNLEQYYKILGLELGASLEEVNQAYKDLVFIWHPDRLPQENHRLIKKSAEKLKEINHARDLLRSFHRQNRNTSTNSRSTPKSQASHQTYKPPQNSYSYRQSYHRTERAPKNNSYSSYSARQAYQSSTHSDSTRQQTNANTKKTNYYYTNTGNSYYRPYYKDMRGIDLSHANLQEKDLSGRNLHQANLSYADLSDSFLHKIILEEANLQGANLFRANLLGANLRKANLQETNLIGADLSGADLSGADLSGAKIAINQKIMVKLTAVKLTGTILPDGSVHS